MILPVAVSTHGEFCPGAVRLQEWLTEKYRARVLLEGDRDDGEKPETLTTAFRREFRSSLLVASCKGMADMLAAAGMPFAGKHAFRAPPPTAAPPADAAPGTSPLCASCAMSTASSAGPSAACYSCEQPLHPHPACCIRVHDVAWCRPCLTVATRAAGSRDADESSAEDSSSEDECSASEKEDEENEEEAGEAGSSSDVDLRDHPRRDEEAGSPDPWDNGPVAPPLAPNPISQRPRRTPSARLVDGNGLARFMPRDEAAAWTLAFAATASPGPGSTASFSPASQHTQGLPLFETFFSPHTPS